MKFLRPTIFAACIFIFASPLLAQQASAPNQPAPILAPKPPVYVTPSKDNYRKLADEVEAALHRDVLDVWFPRTVDDVHGGFRPDFTRDWQPGAKSGGKFY